MGASLFDHVNKPGRTAFPARAPSIRNRGDFAEWPYVDPAATLSLAQIRRAVAEPPPERRAEVR